MQQTEKYKLNLIESSDPFLPDGLNQNTQKVEDAMIAHEEKVKGSLDTFGARVTALEAHRFFIGTYTGNGRVDGFVELGFTPMAIFMIGGAAFDCFFAFNNGNNTSGLAIVENGIRAGQCGPSYNLNREGAVYKFFAFV